MVENPLVSILIPAFNAERWIAETLRSAIGQSWENKEIIVIDDGSTDRTLEIARRFESNAVCVRTQKNQGAAAARNAALRLSKGAYIQWLDADDLLAPGKIASQMNSPHRRHGTGVLLSAAWGPFLFRSHRTIFTPTSLWCDLSPAEWMLRKMEQNLYMQTATWLVSRELSNAAGDWNTSLLGDDDGEYFCRVLLASKSVGFVPEAKMHYRVPGSASLSYIGRSDRKMEAQWRSMQLHVAYMRSLDDSPRARAACVTYLQNWIIFFHPQRPDLVHEADALAKQLGGALREPEPGWKYAWLKRVFGSRAARHAQLVLPGLRWSAQRQLDWALFYFERFHFERKRTQPVLNGGSRRQAVTAR